MIEGLKNIRFKFHYEKLLKLPIYLLISFHVFSSGQEILEFEYDDSTQTETQLSDTTQLFLGCTSLCAAPLGILYGYTAVSNLPDDTKDRLGNAKLAIPILTAATYSAITFLVLRDFKANGYMFERFQKDTNKAKRVKTSSRATIGLAFGIHQTRFSGLRHPYIDVNAMFGFHFQYRMMEFLSIRADIAFSARKHQIEDVIYWDYWVSNQLRAFDVQVEGYQIFFPLFLVPTARLNNQIELYLLLGIGFPYNNWESKHGNEIVVEINETPEYEYGPIEGFGGHPSLRAVLGFGMVYSRYEIEYQYLKDIGDPMSRMGLIRVTEPLRTHQITLGFRFPKQIFGT